MSKKLTNISSTNSLINQKTFKESGNQSSVSNKAAPLFQFDPKEAKVSLLKVNMLEQVESLRAFFKDKTIMTKYPPVLDDCPKIEFEEFENAYISSDNDSLHAKSPLW